MIDAARSAMASEDLPRVDQGGAEQPPGDGHVPLDPVLGIQDRHVELLDGEVLQPGAKNR